MFGLMSTPLSNKGASSHESNAGGVSNVNPNLQQSNSSSISRNRSVDAYVQAIREGDRVTLSQAITLVESTRPEHQMKGQDIIDECLPHTGDSVRVAITGVPGVGKSTFIETLGMQLIDEGHRLAVLAIDPTSERTKGSILGDKTRMGELASRDEVFIRPSPTAGSLGGVARKTRETILLCEAAGYDTIFVETVGVGQSETTVHSMVDFFLLLALAGAGDELQGIKRGIVEMADAIAINKADGNNREAAQQAQSEYQRALHLFPPGESGWTPPVLTCSALNGEGIGEVWQTVQDYCTQAKERGHFQKRRQRQARYWMYQTIEHRLKEDFFAHPDVQSAVDRLEAEVVDGSISSFAAAQQLIDIYRGRSA